MCFADDLFFVLNQSSFVGAIAIGDLIKSTLGPKGMVSLQRRRMLHKKING